MLYCDADLLQKARDFQKLVEAHDLHGLLFQHLELCPRRAWLHLNRVDYAHLDERMRLGAVAHEMSKSRDHSVVGLMGIAPDRIDWKRSTVIEVKGSAGARDAVSCQTRFYALMLMAATGRIWSAENEIIGKKKRLLISISDDDASTMLDIAKRLGEMRFLPLAPRAHRKSICDLCSYRFLCGFS